MISFKVKKEIPKLREDWWPDSGKEWTHKLLLENRKKWPSEVNPDGKPWKSLTPAYAKWKSKNYGSLPMLRISGKMQDSAKISFNGKSFEVQTSSIGIYHQFGTSKMVGRPWMGVPDSSLNILSEISIKNILK